jgi:glutathione peroxidase
MLFKAALVTAIIVMGIGGIFLKIFPDQNTEVPTGSIYDFKIKALNGDIVDFSQYKGKNLMIVNTASRCAYTDQYKDLQKLHQDFGDKVTVLGFPANNFLWQEPGSNKEIADFCKNNYGVSFQMFEKISVKGKDAHPLYKWLKAKSGSSPSWNFCKYIIDKNGNVIAFYGKKVNPLDEAIIEQIQR